MITPTTLNLIIVITSSLGQMEKIPFLVFGLKQINKYMIQIEKRVLLYSALSIVDIALDKYDILLYIFHFSLINYDRLVV